MNPFFLTVIFLVLHCNFLFAFAPRTVVFHAVRPVETSPEIDGFLNEACWEWANKAVEFYEYWKPDPDPGVLKTEFRMLYDEEGIYVGIINYDQNVESIRADRIRRDDPNLWQDDCAEIYFDPKAKGIGYVKFTTNFLGTKHDLKRIDAAVTTEGWSGEGWEVKTSKGKDYWIIEAFFPWSDLGEKANPGDIWMFNHVRYSYSTGNFRGVTWSPGGSYLSPENFGYIYFEEKGKKTEIARVKKVLSETVSPPWELATKDGFLVSLEKGNVVFLSLDRFIGQRKEEVEKWIKKTDDVLGGMKKNPRIEKMNKDMKDLKQEFTSLLELEVSSPIEVKKKGKGLRKIKDRAETIYWNVMIENVLEEEKKNDI